MVMATTRQTLRHENAVFAGSGGISRRNSQCGFQPAFLDTQTETIYLARYGDGRPAPFHLLDGLPEEVVLERNAGGSVSAVKLSIVSGFVLNERFFTREEAATVVAHRLPHTFMTQRDASRHASQLSMRPKHNDITLGRSQNALVKQEGANYERVDG